MALELDHYCPECDEDRTFWRAASTTLHLGEKTKWRCPECNYGFVQIDGDIDSSDADVKA
jgi:rubredoxin